MYIQEEVIRMSSMISLRLDEKDLNLFKSFAKAHGKTLSDFLRESALERIEDQYDLALLREAMENPNPEYISHEELKKELGF